MTTSGNGMIDGADFGEGELAEVNALYDARAACLTEGHRFDDNDICTVCGETKAEQGE